MKTFAQLQFRIVTTALLAVGTLSWAGESAATARPSIVDMLADDSGCGNVQAQHPEMAARLTRLLERCVAAGRSTPGAPEENTGAIRIRRQESQPKRP